MTTYYQPPDPYGVSSIISNIAATLAQQYGVDPTRLIDIALATAQQESDLNPQAVGDNGTSFGLYQLHEGGELGSLTEQQAFDPTTNAQTAIAVMAQTLKANPNASDGEVAAMAQRPADPTGYAQSVNSILAGQGVTGATDGSYAATNTGGGTVTQNGATTPTGPNGQPLTMSDIPQVISYIQQNFGTEAWLLNIPEVATILEQAVVQGLDSTQVQARVEQTTWWKTTSSAVRQYEANKYANPGDYSFTNPGSVAAQTLAQVQAVAAQQGVQLNLQQAQTLANDYMQYGWTAPQLQQAVGALVSYNGTTGNAGSLVAQLQATAGDYYQNLTPASLQSWAQNIAAGTQTIQTFQAQMQHDASLQWTGYAPQLAAGNNMKQLTSNLAGQIGQALEIDPSSINFVTDPKYSKILDYAPPDAPGGQHRVMTQSEALQYVKSDPSFGYQGTQGARDAAATLENTITQAWGKVAG